ncbi:hypothetical protein ACFSCX_05990 [Bacillus salitolerans]|uniref:Uncharacterized protein n=1 Tax=Bacillus salitolerans TaxID=1437434 RepID=A0ABW4LLY3_9BACI
MFKIKKIITVLTITLLILSSFGQVIFAEEKKLSKSEMYELLGFSKEDIKEIKEKHHENSKIHFKDKDFAKLKLKNNDILQLANLGFTKKRIASFTLTDWENVKDRKNAELINVGVTYVKVDGETGEYIESTKEAYEEYLINQVEVNEVSASLCDPDTTCSGENSSEGWILLTVSVTHSSKYSIITDFEWLTMPTDRHTDVFGTGHKENVIVEYSTTFGSYQTNYKDTYGNHATSKTTYFGAADRSDGVGYYHKFNMHPEWYQYNGNWTQAYSDSGYTFADFYWQNTYDTASSAYGNYTHVSTSWEYGFEVAYPYSVALAINNTTKDNTAPNAAVSFSR